MKGKIDLSSGFSSLHNLGLKRLYIKREALSLNENSQMRAASYLAHQR